ncbi:MAG: PaaI family thioesterase [Lachnospiraceae bacterium]|nr:PaaI family thioesterase [Lachnospiraceae bacterium]
MDFLEMSFSECIQRVLDAQKAEIYKNRINNIINLQLEKCDEDNRMWADFTYAKQEMFLNPYNGVHGGIACVLADTCMGMTVSASIQTPPSTTDLQVSYLAPMQGETFRIHADIRKIGKQLVGTTCEIWDMDSGKLCLTAMAKYMLVKKNILADKGASRLMKEEHQ